MSENSLNISAITPNEVGGVELADEALRALAGDAGFVVAGGDDNLGCDGTDCGSGTDYADCGCQTDFDCPFDFGCHMDSWFCS